LVKFGQGCCHGNQLCGSRRQNVDIYRRPPLLFVLALKKGWKNRKTSAHKRLNDALSTPCKNFLNFGLVIPDTDSNHCQCVCLFVCPSVYHAPVLNRSPSLPARFSEVSGRDLVHYCIKGPSPVRLFERIQALWKFSLHTLQHFRHAFTPNTQGHDNNIGISFRQKLKKGML